MENNNTNNLGSIFEKIIKQNNEAKLLQLDLIKLSRSVKNDNDEREQQLSDLADLLEKIEKAITGIHVSVDLDPVVTALENQAQILQKLLEEQTVLRKISEGSLEYDKEAAQYRNTSGREITSKVSGKEIKKGGFIDFETSADRLSGQSKRVRESEDNQIKFKPLEFGKKIPIPAPDAPVKRKANEKDEDTGFVGIGTLGDLGKGIKERLKEVYEFISNKNIERKTEVNTSTDNVTNKTSTDNVTNKTSTDNVTSIEGKTNTDKQQVTAINPETDNIQTTQEIIADSAEQNLTLVREQVDLQKLMLEELKKISGALVSKIPSELPSSNITAPGAASTVPGEERDEGGGLGLGDVLDLGRGLGKKVGRVFKGAGSAIQRGASVLNSGTTSALKFAGTRGGMLAGGALAIGAGAYTAYKGYTGAEEEKQQQLQEIEKAAASGELTPEEAEAKKKELGEATVEKKGGAVGEGAGTAAGGIAGMKAGAALGAAVGSFVPVVGTAVGAGVGALAGGALGAFAGSKLGKTVGEYGGKFFNRATDTAPASTDVVETDPMGNVISTTSTLGAGEELGKKTQQAVTGKTAEPSTGGKAGSVRAKAEELGLDPNNTTGVFQGDVLVALKDKNTGKQTKVSISEEDQARVSAAKELRAGNQRSGELERSARAKASQGAEMVKESTENADLTRSTTSARPALPPIISSSTNNVNTQSFVPLKPSTRPEYSGSALDRYQNRVSVY